MLGGSVEDYTQYIQVMMMRRDQNVYIFCKYNDFEDYIFYRYNDFEDKSHNIQNHCMSVVFLINRNRHTCPRESIICKKHGFLIS